MATMNNICCMLNTISLFIIYYNAMRLIDGIVGSTKIIRFKFISGRKRLNPCEYVLRDAMYI